MGTWEPHRARIARLSQIKAADDPAITDARRDLKEARAADYIRALVDSAPPLSEAQRARLAALLQPPGKAAA